MENQFHLRPAKAKAVKKMIQYFSGFVPGIKISGVLIHGKVFIVGISDCDGLYQNIILLTFRSLEKAAVERRDEGTQIAGSFWKQDQVTDIEQMPLNLLYLAAYFSAISFDK